MPRIRRWFHVSHDRNSDPEVWDLTEMFGDRALRVHDSLLSIADRNEGDIPSPPYDQLTRSIAGQCRMAPKTVQKIFLWMVKKSWMEIASATTGERLVSSSPMAGEWLVNGWRTTGEWLVSDWPHLHEWFMNNPSAVLAMRNYAKYNPTRDANKIPHGEQTVSPPSLPSLPNHKDTTYVVSLTPETPTPPTTLHQKRKARKSAQTDKKETPPAVKTFREVTGHYPPAVLYQEVVEQIGDKTAEMLLPFYKEWCSRGYNTRRTHWLDWVSAGAIPETYGKKPASTTANEPSPAPLPNGKDLSEPPVTTSEARTQERTPFEEELAKREQAKQAREARRAERIRKEEEQFDQQTAAYHAAKEKHHEH